MVNHSIDFYVLKVNLAYSSEKQWITPFPPFAQNGVPLMFPYNSRRDLDSPQYNGWVQLAWFAQLSPGGRLFKGCLNPAREKHWTIEDAWENTYRAFTRLRRNALIQRMAEEESGAWGCVDTRDVIVRLTGQQTNHATSKLFTLWVVAC